MMREKLTIAAAVAALLGGIAIAVPGGAQDDSTDTYRQLNLFGDVFERVRANYVEEVTDEQLIESAINGMLQALDPHSSYLDADSYRDMQVNTRGEFGGLGIEVTLEDGFVKVVSPLDGTPAFRAGIQPGDFISHIDGEPVLGLSLREAVDKMRGPVGTDIDLTIRREGVEPFDVTITRDIITIESVRSRNENGVGYVRITTFNEQATSGLEEAVAKLREELGDEIQGLVLDLRNNPGGLLDEAVAVSDAFLDKGEIVSTRGRDPEQAQRFNAREGDIAEGLPIVVLINGGSASASEIVAGALQDHGRALVMGTKSFGKGSVQTIVPLGSHGAMRLTTSRYYTPSGNSIQATGIEPDIIVEAARIESLGSRDGRREADLRGRLDNPNGGPPDDAADPEDAAESPDGSEEPDNAETAADESTTIVDYQLARAVDLIRGLYFFRTNTIN